MNEDLTELCLAFITLPALEIWVISNNLLVSCLKSISDSKSQDFSANISTSDQRCFKAVDQCWSNVDSTLKMKQIRRRFFSVRQSRYSVSIRRWSNVAQHWRNIKTTLHNVDATLYQCCINLASTLLKLYVSQSGY